MSQDPDPYSVNPPQPNPPSGNVPPPPSTQPLNYGTQSTGGLTDATMYAGPPPTKEEQSMALLAHLLGILGFLGPLIVWLIKKDQSPFVDDQGKEALNFHLTMLIGYIIGAALSTLCVGFLIIPVVWIISTIFSIIGAMKAKDGIAYRYPFAIRLIK